MKLLRRVVHNWDLLKRLVDLRGRTPKIQPIPEVTEEDVERIVRRDFPIEEFTSVKDTLSEYGTEKWHREPTRVRLAVLKLAGGSLPGLRAQTEAARSDYRDVLNSAEYPAYWKAGFGTPRLPESERSKIIDSDWQQYESWLKH